MTVKQLIATLQKAPQDAFVMQSSDSEGNSISALQSLSLESEPEVVKDLYGDDAPKGTKIIVLWPTV